MPLLNEVGEFDLIDRIAAAVGKPDPAVTGIGDDAAIVPVAGKAVIAVDTIVEGRHYRPEWCSGLDVGHRAAAAALSDICAMGAQPTSLLLALAVRPDTEAAWVEEVATGAAEEGAQISVDVVGGDLTASPTNVVTVTALGQIEGEAVTRAGAVPGQKVAIAGRQGFACAGLTVLSRGFRSPGRLVDAYRRPQPQYQSGLDAKKAGATAMIDVSDGLMADAGHIAEASQVTIALSTELIPVADQLTETGAAFNVNPLAWVLTGGEDHALVATFPADAQLPMMFTQIGEVRAGSPEVTVNDQPWTGSKGYEHFS